jgi:RNA polymerase sigma-70 factor (ECF subfamily)
MRLSSAGGASRCVHGNIGEDNTLPGKQFDAAERRDAVFGFVRRLVGRPDLAEDLTQDALERAERRHATYRGKASVRTWVFAIALNVCRDHLRRDGRKGPPPLSLDLARSLASPDDIEHALIEQEMAACISSYVQRLPEQQRTVLTLHDMGGFAHKEIAALLDLSEANSRVLLHRGRNALREILEAH